MKSNGSALAAIFGATRAAQLTGEAFPSHPIVRHGSLRRFPPEFHSGPLSSLERISDAYQGSINAGRNIGAAQSRVVVNGGSVIDFLTLGMSMVLEDLGGSVPTLTPWLHQLEGEIGIPSGRTKLVGFASAKGKGGGLLPHWDAKEGILIQVQGRKRIRLAPNREAVDPTTSHTPGTRAPEELAVQNIRHSVVRNADNTFDVKIQWFGGLSHTTLNLSAEYLPACEWLFEQKGRFSLRDVSTAFPRLNQARLRKLLYFLVQAEALQLAGAGKAGPQG